jgi:hypothetical protein
MLHNSPRAVTSRAASLWPIAAVLATITCMTLIWPGDLDWSGDQLQLIGQALNANEGHQLAGRGLTGTAAGCLTNRGAPPTNDRQAAIELVRPESNGGKARFVVEPVVCGLLVRGPLGPVSPTIKMPAVYTRITCRGESAT